MVSESGRPMAIGVGRGVEWGFGWKGEGLLAGSVHVWERVER